MIVGVLTVDTQYYDEATADRYADSAHQYVIRLERLEHVTLVNYMGDSHLFFFAVPNETALANMLKCFPEAILHFSMSTD